MRRAQRLRTEREFARVYKKGRAYRAPLLVLRAVPNQLQESRFGFTVGRTVGGAVLRNRVKRRLREVARSLSVSQGWDIVVNARARAGSAGFQELRSSLRELLGRAKLLNEREGEGT